MDKLPITNLKSGFGRINETKRILKLQNEHHVYLRK